LGKILEKSGKGETFKNIKPIATKKTVGFVKKKQKNKLSGKSLHAFSL